MKTSALYSKWKVVFLLTKMRGNGYPGGGVLRINEKWFSGLSDKNPIKLHLKILIM